MKFLCPIILDKQERNLRFSTSNIQTMREAPSNARTEGFAWLVRASYLTRESEVTELGQRVISRLQERFEAGQNPSDLFRDLGLPVIATEHKQIFFAISTGKARVLQCPSCQYAARQDLARFTKEAPLQEDSLPIEKVFTPDCYTIDALANFLGIPTRKTAKAILLTRASDGKLIFAIVRGDMQLSEAKLRQHVGDFRTATYEEISATGAAAGFASPIGLKNALIVVDDLIPSSPNLVAGANEDGYHMLNVNYGRDYTAEIVADVVEASAGDTCPNCDGKLELFKADLIAEEQDGILKLYPTEMLQALAEFHHDQNGLTFPITAAPFEIYLIVIPGKELDTISAANAMYEKLQSEGFFVLYDDRDLRAGVKFNDADLIGLPMRITLGERGMQEGNVEVKLRTAKEKELVGLDEVVNYLRENF
jgi:prolyl-tRNA synthetase